MAAKRMRVDLMQVLLENTPSKVLNPDTLARQLDEAGRKDEAQYVRERMLEDSFYRDIVTSCFPGVTVCRRICATFRRRWRGRRRCATLWRRSAPRARCSPTRAVAHQ